MEKLGSKTGDRDMTRVHELIKVSTVWRTAEQRLTFIVGEGKPAAQQGYSRRTRRFEASSAKSI